MAPPPAVLLLSCSGADSSSSCVEEILLKVTEILMSENSPFKASLFSFEHLPKESSRAWVVGEPQNPGWTPLSALSENSVSPDAKNSHNSLKGCL